MIDKLIGFSIKNKLVIAMMTIALAVWGSVSLSKLPIDAVPDITNNQVQVITVASSLAAQEVERLITFPVEITMATIPGIEELRSFSRFGLSVVTIVFKDNIDVYWARQQVHERLSEAKNQIPDGIGSPELAPVTTGLGEIYQYVVHTAPGYEDRYSATELRSIQDWIIKRQLLGTKGVADVSSFGGHIKQYEVAIHPNKLASMNLTITEVFTALEHNNQNTGGAYIEKEPNAYFIRSEGLVTSLSDIENIVVKSNSAGMPILVGDIAEVKFGHAVRYGASTRNGEGEVVSAIVMMLKGANSAEVIENIKLRIEQIEKNLPEGVVIEPFLDRTKLVDKAIETVSKNLIEGALIVIFILILLLGNIRAGLVVASVIPLSMLFAFGMMRQFGVSGNLMSLGAIDFGLIVDGAVIIVESIVHRISHSKMAESGVKKLNRRQMDEEVYAAATKIRSSAAFGEIIILIVYLPILALVGIEGKMFKPMAQTVVFAILGAFILSLTYVPMMSALVLKRDTLYKRNISDKIMDFFQRRYRPSITYALKRKGLVVVTTVFLFLAGLIVFSGLGGEFIPSLDEGDFAVETRVMTGSALSETIHASNQASQILLDHFPEVEQVVGKIGSGEIPTDPMPIEACDLMVILKDKSEWTSADTREELAEKMADALAVIPGVSFGFQQPIQMRFNELMTGARQDVVIKIYGEDLDLLTQYASQIGQHVNTVEGAADLYVEQVSGLEQIQVVFNRKQMAKYGVHIEEVNRLIEMAFAGKHAGLVYEGERRFDLVLRFDESHRQEISDVQNLFVSTPDGRQIPLSELADVSFKSGPNQIQRDDSKRRITVGFNVRNRDVESIVAEIREKVEKNLRFEPGYYVTYGGQFQNLMEARQRLMIAVPVALLLIFILLFFTFKSIKQSLLIFTAIPLSAIGGVFALYVRGLPFSISAGVGFIALFGVAVLNGIVLIAEFNRLKTEGLLDLEERVLKGTQIRLRPVLMTALVASLAFLPMALSQSSGSEVQRPLATVVIGGLLTATFLTLIVLPVLYVYFEKGIKKVKPPQVKSLLMLLLLLPLFANAQREDTPNLTLDQAIGMALERHPMVASARLDISVQEKMKKSSVDLGKTEFTWQHGQYNSIAKNDNYFDVTQRFAFPTVYVKQHQLAQEQIKRVEWLQSTAENELISQVKSAYYDLQYSQSKVRLLRVLDSIFIDFSASASLRYETGESSMLEKNAALLHQLEIANQLRSAKSDVEMASAYFYSLLYNEGALPMIADIAEKATLRLPEDSLGWSSNPLLGYIGQQLLIEEDKHGLEKAKMLPDFSLGYYNMSMIGPQPIDGTDQYFGPSDRFSGFRVGMSVPLWFRPQQAQVQASKIKIEQAGLELKSAENQLQTLYKQSVQEYEKQKNNLVFYEEHALNQAKMMVDNAQRAFSEGEVGYLEYLQAVNQGNQIYMDWLAALNAFNQSVVQLQYLAGIQ